MGAYRPAGTDGRRPWENINRSLSKETMKKMSSPIGKVFQSETKNVIFLSGGKKWQKISFEILEG
jgi:hypothetical protein